LLFISLRDRRATLNIHSDRTTEEHYLMLPELGRVLQALRGTLPGGCIPGWGTSDCKLMMRLVNGVLDM